MGKRIPFSLLLLLSFLSSFAQVYDPVKWKFTSKPREAGVYELQLIATIEKGWHMYGLKIPENGPIATSFTFEDNPGVQYVSELKSLQKPEVKFDPTFEMDLELYSGNVTFIRKVRIKDGETVELKGTIEFMACDDSRCLPPKEESFSFKLAGEIESELPVEKDLKVIEPNEDTIAGISDTLIQATSGSIETSTPLEEEKDRSLFSLFLIAFLAGFGALLTPCVYPIIPLTVSFFMRDTSRSRAVFNGIFFGISIVFIYTFVGLIVGLTQVDLVRLISSHWLPNLIFLLIFLALAFSFFGMFEITLPGSMSNKIDQQADKGGFLGPFFMALATVVISFSCTGPIVGVVLGGAMQGEIIKPVIGMLGFALSFALPFTILALFPGILKNMPKSGGWLNSVKVFFAFILLAFSLIFLSNLGLTFITRSSILIIAIVIFLLLGFYLLGLIKFSHDSPVNFLSVPRLLIAISVLAFTIYLFTGLLGSGIKLVEPFLPASSEKITLHEAPSTFDNSMSTTTGNVCSGTPKYAEFLSMPFGLKGYFDYEEALACAAQLDKPVLLDFAGHYCKNCKKMYAEVWSDPKVQTLLRDSFVLASLYTDDRTELPIPDQVTSTLDGKVKKTIGKKFNDLQISKFGSNALPLYVIVDSKGKVITDRKYYTYSSSVNNFVEFLQEGIVNYHKRSN